jgi:hypothetical protein
VSGAMRDEDLERITERDDERTESLGQARVPQDTGVSEQAHQLRASARGRESRPSRSVASSVCSDQVPQEGVSDLSRTMVLSVMHPDEFVQDVSWQVRRPDEMDEWLRERRVPLPPPDFAISLDWSTSSAPRMRASQVREGARFASSSVLQADRAVLDMVERVEDQWDRLVARGIL